MRRGGGLRPGMRSSVSLPDVPLSNYTIVYESAQSTSGKSIPYACPGPQMSDDCHKLTEQQQRLVANGSLRSEHGSFRVRGAGRGGRIG